MLQILSNIKYVYFIKSSGVLVYIGRSAKPLIRIRQHSKITKKLNEFILEIYGPYEELYANELESAEIHRVLKSNNKHFLSYTTKKYDKSKKLSVKDFGAKTIFKFAKKGKVKKMVG